MSIQAVAWVLEHSTTKKLDRLVLISLANHADERGECWPSVERIAREAGTTSVQARRILSALEEGGHIVRLINGAPDDRMRSDRKTNLYRMLDGGALSVPPWVERARVERANGRASSDTTGARPARERATAERAPNHQGTIIEPSVEPSLLPVSVDAFDFAEFWQSYPRKDGKASALKAWPKACKKHPASAIITAARQYAGDPNRDPAYTKHAATWLNGECWNDPPLPSRTGLSAARAKEHRTADAINSVFGDNDGSLQLGDGQ